MRYGRGATTNYHGTIGTAKYDSLQARAQKRFANDFQASFSYTWSKSLGYTGEEGGAGLTVNHPLYFDKNYGLLPQHRAHNFQFSGIWELPFGRGKRFASEGAGAAILGGWQINGILSAYTGRPSRPAAAGTSLNAQGSSQFADCLGPVATVGQRTQWWDRANLAQPADPASAPAATTS